MCQFLLPVVIWGVGACVLPGVWACWTEHIMVSTVPIGFSHKPVLSTYCVPGTTLGKSSGLFLFCHL